MTWSRRRERWAAERANPAIERAPERRQRFSTISDVAVSRLYGPWSWTDETPAGGAAGGGGPTAVDHLGQPLRRDPGRWDDFDPLRDVGFPGEPPFTRGIHKTGYREQPWTIRMFSGFGSVEETNQRYKDLLNAGNNGLTIASTCPPCWATTMTTPRAEGEFGSCGVAGLARSPTWRSCSRAARSTGHHVDDDQQPARRSGPCSRGRGKRGIPRAKLAGTLQNDILKEFIAEKEYIFPPRAPCGW